MTLKGKGGWIDVIIHTFILKYRWLLIALLPPRYIAINYRHYFISNSAEFDDSFVIFSYKNVLKVVVQAEKYSREKTKTKIYDRKKKKKHENIHCFANYY